MIKILLPLQKVFSRMILRVKPNDGSSTKVMDLMNLGGGGQDYTVFDYDGIHKPCDSCRFLSLIDE